jgi:antitoxin component of MazEF toxin-antitoxin module
MVFKTKVRTVGTSLGVLIPKEVIEELKIREGEEIDVAVLKQKRIEEIKSLFGIAKGAAPFVRERNTKREQQY